MNFQIFRHLSDNKLINTIIRKPSPWWVVLISDIVIVALSCLITYGLSPTATLYSPGWLSSPFAQGLITFGIYTVLMPVLHTYMYIVRLSVLEDLYRVILLILMAVGVQFVIALATHFSLDLAYFGLWNIFVVALLVFTMMMLSRLSMKYIYRQLVGGKHRQKVVVLGSVLNSFSFVSAFNNDPEGKYKVVALISVSPNLEVNTLNEIPIYPYSPESLEAIFEKYATDTLIFPANQLKWLRSGHADSFLTRNIKLMMYEPVKELSEDNNSRGTVRDIAIEDLLGRDVIEPDTKDVKAIIRGQVVMVTGAAGSIGSEIVRQVAAMGADEIVLLDQAETPMHDLQLLMEATFPQTKIHLFIGDVSNAERIEQAFARYRPRYVFHAAAYKHVPMMERNPSEAIMTNVFGTKNVADLSLKYDVEKFVMISTDKAVNPTNVMGASKRIAEIYVQSLFFHSQRTHDGRSTQFITTRFGNVLGSNGSVIPLFRKQIAQGGPVTVTHRDIIRYFMTIPEACSLVLQAATMGHGGEIFVFDMGQPVKIYDLAKRMISLSGLQPGKDIEIIETGLRPGEKLYEELLNDKEKTMATAHNKIMVAKVRIYDFAEVLEHFDALRPITLQSRYTDIVAEMKNIVPEFKSQNSQWASLDDAHLHTEHTLQSK